MEDNQIEQEAISFAKINKKKIAKELTNLQKYPPDEKPISIFMAGSPGAGKTEFSQKVISLITDLEGGDGPIRIDGDELRGRFPRYTGSNSVLFQKAISILVDKILDLAFLQKQSFILDGTCAKYEKTEFNIDRSLGKNREVVIFYVYQDPIIAWDFTQKREFLEGRNIPRSSFVEQFFGAKNTLTRIRKKYTKEVAIYLVKKDHKNDVENIVKIIPDGPSVDDLIENTYTKESLLGVL